MFIASTGSGCLSAWTVANSLFYFTCIRITACVVKSCAKRRRRGFEFPSVRSWRRILLSAFLAMNFRNFGHRHNLVRNSG